MRVCARENPAARLLPAVRTPPSQIVSLLSPKPTPFLQRRTQTEYWALLEELRAKHCTLTSSQQPTDASKTAVSTVQELWNEAAEKAKHQHAAVSVCCTGSTRHHKLSSSLQHTLSVSRTLFSQHLTTNQLLSVHRAFAGSNSISRC